jgi:hypothetical protein
MILRLVRVTCWTSTMTVSASPLLGVAMLASPLLGAVMLSYPPPWNGDDGLSSGWLAVMMASPLGCSEMTASPLDWRGCASRWGQSLCVGAALVEGGAVPCLTCVAGLTSVTSSAWRHRSQSPDRSPKISST